jgi:hypothetical protein
MQREGAIKNSILLALGEQGDVLAWNAPCGVFRSFDDPQRIVRVGPPGRADILGVCNGRAIAIEVKTATGRLRPDQERWRDAFTQRGGVWVLARSAEDAMEAVMQCKS